MYVAVRCYEGVTDPQKAGQLVVMRAFSYYQRTAWIRSLLLSRRRGRRNSFDQRL